MGGILKERFVWNVDFVEGGVVNFKDKVLKIFSEILFFFVLPIKRRVFRWSKYRVV